MLTIAPGWELEVERGPDWLMVRLVAPDQQSHDAPPLAEQLWALLERHCTYRLLLELDPTTELDGDLLAELLQLHGRIHARGGVVRLCSPASQHRQALRDRGLVDCLILYDSRREAILGEGYPARPR